MSNITKISVEDVEKRRRPSKHYVYMIVVGRADGAVNVIYRRYSRFFELQCRILDRFPVEAGKYDPTERILPFLPGKILIGRSHIRAVAVKRQEPIDLYCKELLKLKNVMESPEVQEFFSITDEDLNPTESAEKLENNKTTEVVGKEISAPVLNEQYVVIATYHQDGPKEVNLRTGEYVDVIEKYENGWWFVSAEDGQGWAPSSYLERTDGQEEDTATPVENPDGEAYMCVKNYSPKFDDEIQLVKGTPVSVLEKNLNGWWLVRRGNVTGKAPSTYLTKTDTVRFKNIVNITERFEKDTPGQQRPATGARLAVPVGSHLASLPVSPNAQRKAPSPKHVATNHAVPKNDDRDKLQIMSTEIKGIKWKFKLKKDKDQMHITPVNQSRSVAKAGVSASNVNRKRSKPLPALPDSDSDDTHDYENVRPPPRRRSVNRETPGKQEAAAEPDYLCVADFVGQAPGTIDVKEGQKVKVIDKNASGWSYVQYGGNEGWAPTNIIMRKDPLTKKLSPLRPPLPSPKQSPTTTRAQTTRPTPVVSSNEPSRDGGSTGITGELMQKLKVRNQAEDNTSRTLRERSPKPASSGQRPNKPVIPTNPGNPSGSRVNEQARWSEPLGPKTNVQPASNDSDSEYVNDDEIHEARCVVARKAAKVPPKPKSPRGAAKGVPASNKPVLPSKPVKPSKQNYSQSKSEAITEAKLNVKAMRSRFEQN